MNEESEISTISHQQLIQAIDSYTFDQFVSVFKDIPCTKFSHPDILLHIIERIYYLHSNKQCENGKLLRFLIILFKETCKQSNLETIQRFFQLRLSNSSLGLQSIQCKSFGKSKSFTLLLNQVNTDEKSNVYKRFVSKLTKWAAFSPVETLLLMIDKATSTPSLIPPIAQVLTKQLRPIVMFKFDSSPRTLMLSLVNQQLFFSSATLSSSIDDNNGQLERKNNSCFVYFVKEFFKARYLKSQSCIINVEAIVIEWLTIVRAFPSTIFTQIDVLNQLIESNLGGKLLWSNICLVDLLLYFVTCIIELRKRGNVKELFLLTIHSIMKRHIQRKITRDEVDEMFTKVKPQLHILLTYFNDLCEDLYILEKFINLYNDSINMNQLLLLASIIGPDKMCILEKNIENDGVESVKDILPFMTRNEIVYSFAFFASIYGKKVSIEFFVSALVQLCDENWIKNIDWTYVISSFDFAVRLFAFPDKKQELYSLYEYSTGDVIDCQVIPHSYRMNGHVSLGEKKKEEEEEEYTSDNFQLKKEEEKRKKEKEKSTALETSKSDSVQGNTSSQCATVEEGLNGFEECRKEIKRLVTVVPPDCKAIVSKLHIDLSG